MALRMRDHLRAIVPELRVEPTPKRIRCLVENATIVDTTAAMLVWEPRRIVPMYAVPEADLTADLVPFTPPPPPPDLPPALGPTDFPMHTAPGEALSVKVDGRELTGSAFRSDDPDLAGYVVLDFDPFTWVEEDEAVVGHPHDPFKRIDVLRSNRHVVVSLGDVVLADSRSPYALLETHLPVRWYFPQSDVRLPLLTPSDARTTCAYKGHASYFSVAGAGELGRDLAWTYPEPLHDALRVRNMIAFFNERADIDVDGVRIRRPITPWSSPEEQRQGLDFG